MRGTGRGMRWLGALLLAIAGCQTEPSLKPEIPPQYVLPPTDDPRFSSPPSYPKETLDSEQYKKDQSRASDPSSHSNGQGMGGSRGMGGGAMGGGAMGGGGMGGY